MDLADVGAVVRIGQLSHSRLANAKPACKFYFGDALGAHSRKESKLCGDYGRHGDEFLTIDGLSGYRDVPLLVDISGQRRCEGVFRHCHCLRPVASAGNGLRNVWEGGYQDSVFIGVSSHGYA